MGDAVAVGIAGLGEAGGGAHDHPAAIFKSPMAEDFGILQVLAGGPASMLGTANASAPAAVMRRTQSVKSQSKQMGVPKELDVRHPVFQPPG